MAPAHRRHPRPRRGRRPDLDLDGLRRRHRRGSTAEATPPQRHAPRRGRGDRHRHRRCPRLRPPERPAAPRRQTGEHPARQARVRGSTNPAGRLRNRALGRRRQRSHRDQHDRRHRLLRRTRAADGRTARRPGRPIRVGRHRVSSPDRVAAVPQLESGRRDQPAPVGGAARDRLPPPGPRESRSRPGQGAVEEPQGPVRALRGLRQGAEPPPRCRRIGPRQHPARPDRGPTGEVVAAAPGPGRTGSRGAAADRGRGGRLRLR
nr:hypothetical protein CPGR_02470 [Mycolicibacterium malmesburyense]